MTTENNEQQEYLWHIHEYLNEYIRHADTKAELVIGWTSAVMGALIAAGFQKKFDITVTGTLSAIGFTLLLGGFLTSLLAVAPRVNTVQLPGFIFWKSILAHKTVEKFVSAAMALTTSDLISHLTTHLFELSAVANKKYWCVGVSVVFASCGSVVSGLMFMYS